MNNMEIKDIIWSLMNSIRGIIYSRNPALSAIRLLFLKYVIDNNVGVTSIIQTRAFAQIHLSGSLDLS